MARSRLALCFAALSLTACGGELTTRPEQTGATDQLVGKCSATEYEQAAEAFGRAVSWSKDRLGRGVCESEHGYLWSIADEASRAVMSCAGFREVLRTSAAAAPVREVLAQSLSLRSITGELLVIRDSEFQDWTGVEQFFEGGLSFWARAEGAYGSAVHIEFTAGGKATHGHQVYDESSGDITWGSSPATYRIEKTGERASDKRLVIVEVDGRTERYTLTARAPYMYRDAPLFTLEPYFVPGSTEVEPTGEAELHELFSLVSECDA